MSIAEILQEASKLSVTERKELLTALWDAEQQDRQSVLDAQKPFVSFAEAAKDIIGSVKSGLPPDLSTNKKYMEDFGRD